MLDEAEVAAMRERNGIDTPGGGSQGLTASAAKRGPVDSGKGVRIQVWTWRQEAGMCGNKSTEV